MPSAPGSQMLAGKSSEHQGDGHTLFQFQLHGDTAEKLGPVTDRNGVKRHRCNRQASS